MSGIFIVIAADWSTLLTHLTSFTSEQIKEIIQPRIVRERLAVFAPQKWFFLEKQRCEKYNLFLHLNNQEKEGTCRKVEPF